MSGEKQGCVTAIVSAIMYLTVLGLMIFNTYISCKTFIMLQDVMKVSLLTAQVVTEGKQ